MTAIEDKRKMYIEKKLFGLPDFDDGVKMGKEEAQKEFEDKLIDFYRDKMKYKQLSVGDWYSAETISGLDLEEFMQSLNNPLQDAGVNNKKIPACENSTADRTVFLSPEREKEKKQHD